MRNPFIFLVLLMAGLQSAAVSANKPPPLEPFAEGGQVLRHENFQILNTAGDVGWDQFDRVRLSADWQAPKVDTVSAVGSKGVTWVRIDLAETQSQFKEWRLEIRWPHVSRVDMAAWDPQQGLTDIFRAGKDLPLSDLAIAHKNIVFPFRHTQDHPTTLYLRVDEPYLIYLPMMVFTAEDFAKHDLSRIVLFSMAFGILAIMIIYNLFLYFAVRDAMYLFYANTVFSSLLYVLAISGYGRLAFWAGNPWLDAHASSVFAAYCFLSATYFFRVFLDLPRYGGWMLRSNTLLVSGFSLILAITMTPFAAYGVLLLGVLSAVNGVALMITAVLVWRRGNPSAIYFIVAWAGIGVSTSFVVMSLRGQINYFPAIEYSQVSGFVLEIVLLSLALADRIRRQRIAKEKAQSSLLRLQEQTNKELELQVELRTRELESAMVDLKSANRELSKLTKIDPLTNVNNRRQFDVVAKREIENAQKTGQALALMMIDIDHFKVINDTFGHVVGDKCLKLIANCIAQNVRGDEDFVARYGGEEFALILPNTDETGAHALAERIRAAIESVSLIYEGKNIRMTASFGVCSHAPHQHESISTLIEVADAALYRAKENGRNQVMTDSVSRSA